MIPSWNLQLMVATVASEDSLVVKLYATGSGARTVARKVSHLVWWCCLLGMNIGSLIVISVVMRAWSESPPMDPDA